MTRVATNLMCNAISANAVGKSIQAQHGLHFDVNAVKIAPGEYYVTSEPGDVVVTVLGSCVAACIRDPVAGVGGMNHFMLPESVDGVWGKAQASLRFGNFAMERLINDILVRGGRRERLEVKIVGGGNVLDNLVDVGQRNAIFVEEYLAAEGLSVVSRDLRGDMARRVHHLPADGRLWVKYLPRDLIAQVREAEATHYGRIAGAAVGGSVELF